MRIFTPAIVIPTKYLPSSFWSASASISRILIPPVVIAPTSTACRAYLFTMLDIAFVTMPPVQRGSAFRIVLFKVLARSATAHCFSNPHKVICLHMLFREKTLNLMYLLMIVSHPTSPPVRKIRSKTCSVSLRFLVCSSGSTQYIQQIPSYRICLCAVTTLVSVAAL